MARWTDYQDDSERLPPGIRRTGYDADTGRYTFEDRDGNVYRGPPHSAYGALTLVRSISGRPGPEAAALPLVDRPQAFAADNSDAKPAALSVDTQAAAATFQDFLPAHLITSPSASKADAPVASPVSPKSRFRSVVRRAALPTMHNVVQNLRRSVTHKQGGPQRDGESGRGYASLQE